MKKFILGFILASVFNSFGQISNLQVQAEMADPSDRQVHNNNNLSERPVNLAVSDTLHYFFNKHYFRNSTVANANLNFYTVKSPYQTTLALTHYGSVFLNSNPITISGLEGLVMKNPTSPSAAVPFRLYLCNVNSSNLPVFPPLDSVQSSVSNATNGIWRGGTFTNTPIIVTGNFAVLFKSSSTIPGDTVRMFLNNANTTTSTATPAMRYGEGLGALRFNGNWQSNTNTFGSGTDYEFVVAPYVQYTINANAIVLTPTICNLTQGSFSNVSTPMTLNESRFFNFNKFKPFWAPTNTLMPVTDSIYGWSFTGSTTPPTTSKHASAIFNTLGNQTASLSVRVKSYIGGLLYDKLDSYNATITVNNGSAPPLAVTGNTRFCSSGYITTTLTASGSTSYTWTSPYVVTSSIVVSASTNVVYTVMSSNAGCTAIQIVSVMVNPLPSVFLSPSTNSVCNSSAGGQTITLTGTPVGGFYTGNNVAGNKFTPSSIGTSTAAYSYTNNATGCSNTATVSLYVLNCNSIPTQALSSIGIYPNPAVAGRFVIKNLHGSNKVELYNLLGSLMYSTNCETEECLVDISTLPQGHYFVKVSDAKGNSRTVKIVNQN